MFNVENFVYRQFDKIGKSGLEMRVNCPFCGDTKQHLYINSVKEVCHCFKCDYSANWIQLVMDITGLPYHRAIGELYTTPRMLDFDHKISIFNLKEKHVAPQYAVELPEGFKRLDKSRTHYTRIAKKYLLNRGVDEEMWIKYNIGEAISIPGRIIIPVEFDYWQARRLLKWMEPKYINPRNPAKAAIFNSEALNLYEEIVVCEGIFSAIAVGDNAIALLGKELPDEKYERIRDSRAKKIIVALDSDAKKQALEIADRLARCGKDVTVWDYENGDPAENDGNVSSYKYSYKHKVAAMLGR